MNAATIVVSNRSARSHDAGCATHSTIIRCCGAASFERLTLHSSDADQKNFHTQEIPRSMQTLIAHAHSPSYIRLRAPTPKIFKPSGRENIILNGNNQSWY